MAEAFRVNQVALDSVLMLAKQKYQLAHDKEWESRKFREEAEELQASASSALAELNAPASAVMRRLNKDLHGWYEDLTRDPDPTVKRHKYDNAPNIAWGKDIGGYSTGFRASYRFQEDSTDVSLSAHVYHHRYRLLLSREISTTKWDEIVKFLETLAEAGKFAVTGLYRSGAPSWLDKAPE